MYKFSFIVIMKDTREYLERCLDSISNQSYKNFETIVIDDHSITRSDDIINRITILIPVLVRVVREIMVLNFQMVNI